MCGLLSRQLDRDCICPWTCKSLAVLALHPQASYLPSSQFYVTRRRNFAVGVALVEAIQLCIRNELGSNYGKFIVQKDRYDGHVYPICRFNCTVRHFIQQRDKKHEREREEIEGCGYIQ
jgi:hypothetical protein